MTRKQHLVTLTFKGTDGGVIGKTAFTVKDGKDGTDALVNTVSKKIQFPTNTLHDGAGNSGYYVNETPGPTEVGMAMYAETVVLTGATGEKPMVVPYCPLMFFMQTEKDGASQMTIESPRVSYDLSKNSNGVWEIVFKLFLTKPYVDWANPSTATEMSGGNPPYFILDYWYN